MPSRSPTTPSTGCPVRSAAPTSTGRSRWPSGCVRATSRSTAGAISGSAARSAEPSRAGSATATARKAIRNTSRPRRSGCPIDGRGRHDAYIDYSSAGAAAGSPTTNWSARRMGGAVVTSARRTCGSSTRRPALRNHICDFARVASDNIGTCRRRMPPFDDGGQTSTAGDGTALRAHAVPVATRTHDRR